MSTNGVSAGEPFRIWLAPTDKILMALVHAQQTPGVGRVVRQLLKWRGTDVPQETLQPGHGIVLQHGGHVVVHRTTRLGNNVMLLHNATIGRADLWQPAADDYVGVVVEDDVIIGAGAAVLVSHGTLTLGRGSVVGANAVLTHSTGPGEIWAGNPAVKIGDRSDFRTTHSVRREGIEPPTR